jgi:hypothetical protein
MNLRAMFVISMLAACGDDGGGGTGGVDASFDAPVAPATITVTGQADSIGLGGRSPEEGIVVTAHRNSDEATVVATATSGADGKFTMTIETGGVALDGYLLAKGGNFKDTYLYPPGPLAADTDQATCLMLTQGTFDAVSTLAGADQEPGKGWIGVLVVDGTNTAVAGATVTSTPEGIVRYNGDSGRPEADATSTQPDGIGYIFNLTAGNVTVGAEKAGSTFTSHPVNARADQVTLTIVQ